MSNDCYISGCEALGGFLPDMYNQCHYRTCVYGPNPWITTNGELSIHDVKSECQNGEAVPLGTTYSTEEPCEFSDAFCAGMNITGVEFFEIF